MEQCQIIKPQKSCAVRATADRRSTGHLVNEHAFCLDMQLSTFLCNAGAKDQSEDRRPSHSCPPNCRDLRITAMDSLVPVHRSAHCQDSALVFVEAGEKAIQRLAGVMPSIGPAFLSGLPFTKLWTDHSQEHA